MSEYEQLSKGQSRVAYTRRIMEIVANIQKQKEDIGRILADTRKVCLYLFVCIMSNHLCVFSHAQYMFGLGTRALNWPQVQKEINHLTGKLDRVFTMTDEQVYKDARKDESRRQAYKLLAALREVCEREGGMR